PAQHRQDLQHQIVEREHPVQHAQHHPCQVRRPGQRIPPTHHDVHDPERHCHPDRERQSPEQRKRIHVRLLPSATGMPQLSSPSSPSSSPSPLSGGGFSSSMVKITTSSSPCSAFLPPSFVSTTIRFTTPRGSCTVISKSRPCAADVTRVRTLLPGSCSRRLGFRNNVFVDCRPLSSVRVTLIMRSQSGW